MYIDTHSHIYAKEFLEDIDEVITRSIEMGVERIYMPNIDKDSIVFENSSLNLSTAHSKIFMTNIQNNKAAVDA